MCMSRQNRCECASVPAKIEELEFHGCFNRLAELAYRESSFVDKIFAANCAFPPLWPMFHQVLSQRLLIRRHVTACGARLRTVNVLTYKNKINCEHFIQSESLKKITHVNSYCVLRFVTISTRQKWFEKWKNFRMHRDDSEVPLAADVTLQLLRHDVGRPIMLRVHVTVHRHLSAYITDHSSVDVVAFSDVLGEVRHHNHFVAMRTFGAGVIRSKMVVEQRLSGKTFDAPQIRALELFHVVDFLDVTF